VAVDQPDWLTGASVGALAFLAAATDVLPVWDRSAEQGSWIQYLRRPLEGLTLLEQYLHRCSQQLQSLATDSLVWFTIAITTSSLIGGIETLTRWHDFGCTN